MSSAAAIGIAIDYLHRKRPGISFDRGRTSYFPEPGGTSVTVTMATSVNSGAEEATVVVLNDGAVDEAASRLNQRR